LAGIEPAFLFGARDRRLLDSDLKSLTRAVAGRWLELQIDHRIDNATGPVTLPDGIAIDLPETFRVYAALAGGSASTE
jgi:hypothetical protein